MSRNMGFAASPNGTKNCLLKDYVVDYSADPTGVADCCTALANWGIAAKAQSLAAVLTIPAGTFNHTGSANGFNAQFFAAGVKSMKVKGAGRALTTFKIPQTNTWAPPFFGSLGQQNDALTSTPVATVNAGATSLFCLTPSEASRFPAGRWALLTGIDLQGTIEGNYGFPTNPQFFDFFKILSNNTTTGEVRIDRPLTDSYKSTWALQYGNVGGGGVSQGGPAWLYCLDSRFDTTTIVRDMTFDLPNASTPWAYFANCVDMTIDNCVFTGTSGPCPSVNVITRWKNLDLTNAVVEVDKIIQDFYIDTCTHQANPSGSKFFFQSSSIKNFYVDNSDLNWLTGLGRNNYLSNSTIDKLWFSNGYGMGRLTRLNNCVVQEFIGGSSGYSVSNYPMASGVIRTRRKMVVSGMTSNPSGKVRLTVDSTTDVGDQSTWNFAGLFTNRAGQDVITVVDATTVDIANITVATGGNGGVPVVWTGGGSLNGAAQSWAIPGYWCNMIGTATGGGMIAGAFKVLDQWNDADYIYVQTDQAGGWPTGIVNFGPHPCIDFAGTGNTGCAEVLEHSMAPAQNKPIWSYFKRTYDETLTTTGTALKPNGWGAFSGTSAISINVTTPYTGGGSLSWKPTQLANHFRVWRGGAAVLLDMTINAKIAGNRVYNAVTQTWSGAQSGDSLPVLQAGDRLGGVFFSAPTLSANVNGQGLGPVITWETQLDQGIS